jgi:hypothetical protein
MPHNSLNSMNFLTAAKRFAAIIFASAFFYIFAVGQANETAVGGAFRVGERITYVLSTDRYPNAGFGEIRVVSRGRLGTRDAIELAAKFKTVDLFSATGFLADETFTTFVATETGMPLFVKRTNYTTGSPKERAQSYLETPANGFDLLSLIYRLRGSFEGGSSILLDNGRSFPITFQAAGVESITSDAGTFDTTILSIQSDYFKEIGVSELRLNIDNGTNRLPVLIRAKMQNGEVRAKISSVQVTSPEPVATPIPIETPRPVVTPTPSPTPEIYVNNQPLSEELAFVLGERLEYRVTYGAQVAGKIVFEAKERKQFNGLDSLLITATVAQANPPSTAFVLGDRITAQVDPTTLLPRQAELVFGGPLAAFGQTAVFDERTSSVTYGGINKVDVPVGTHSVLSLLYAMRSFKLNPTPDSTNPVNDTRVSVFWANKANIFVLRPVAAEITTADGRKIPAIVANITTNDPVLDQLSPKVWLSQDARRVPLKFSIGQFQFELENSSVILPK